MIWRVPASSALLVLLTVLSDGAAALLLQQRHGTAVSGLPVKELPIAFTASFAAGPAPGPAPGPGPVAPIALAPAPMPMAVMVAPAPAPVLPLPPPGVAPMAPAPAPTVPMTAVAGSSSVDTALAAALQSLQVTAHTATEQQVALLNQSAQTAVQAGTMAVQGEINRKLEQQLKAMAPTKEEFEEERAKILAEKRQEMKAKVEEVTASAEEIAKKTVDNATGTHLLHSGDVVKKLEATELEARELSEEAIRAERLGDAASRSALAWLEKMPVGEAENISRLEKTSVNLALTLQSQAAEAGRIDKFVDKLVSETKVSSDEAERIAANSTIASMEALEQATVNSRTVKEVEDLADQVSNAAATGMATAAEAEQAKSDGADAAAAQEAARQAQAQMAEEGMTPR